MGSIYRRGTIWWLMYRQHGKLMRETSGSTKERVARRMLRAREGDIEHGVVVVTTRDRVTFDDAADDLIKDFETNGRASLDVCKRRIKKHLTPFFGARLLACITTSDVRAYIGKRQADSIVGQKARRKRTREGWIELPEIRHAVSNGEINRELTTLKRIFTLAVQADKLTRKPHIPMLQERNTRTGFFEQEQLAAVLRHLPAPLRPVVQFMAITGWRGPSEVLLLEWRQVDFEAGEVRLDPHTTKNDEGRVFPMTTELRTLLEAQHAEHKRLEKAGQLEPWVFFRMVAEGRGGKKKPQPIVSFLKAFKSACVKAGCPGRIPHDLRRTAVRNLVRAGIPERVAMTMTGHKTRSVFERYNVVAPGDLKSAAAMLDRAHLQRGNDRGDHKSDHSDGKVEPSADRVARIS
jgi:integrase